MTLRKQIKKIAKSNRVLFTTPSHDRTSFVIPTCSDIIGRKFFFHDLSEINDLDNLSEPNEAILESMKNSAALLQAEKVFYLPNGSSSGITASMLAVLKQGDKVLISRNCHKSVLNGLVLTGAEPIWFLPELNEEWSIFNGVNPFDISKNLSENKEIKAVIITSPTYEGVFSDISEIAKICHQHNVLLIVDEAHGALKSFAPEYFGKNALSCGADIAVQSLHKTCGAPNPAAILLCGKNINYENLQNSLNLINTTSPSYPIIASIEAVIEYLFSNDGKNKIKNLVENITEFKNAFKNFEDIEICTFNDTTKIMAKIKGLSGFDLSDILYDEFNIEDELANNSASVLYTGIGTTKHKLKILEKALKTVLSTKYSFPALKKNCPIFLPQMVLTPREAFFAEKEEINPQDAFGRICAEIISEYPPGIPFLLLGEVISHEHINYLKNKNKLIKVVR